MGKAGLVFLSIGTLLIGFILFSPILLSLIGVFVQKQFHFDYLLTSELGMLAFIGVALVFLGSLLERSVQVLQVVFLILGVLSFGICVYGNQIFETTSLIWLCLVLYNLSLITVFACGVQNLHRIH